MAAFVLVAKGVAALREVAVASRYGVGEVVDAYQVASSIMLWLPGALGGAMTVVLVPALIALRDRPSERGVFLAELQASSLWGGLLVSVFVLALTPFLLPMLFSRLSQQALDFSQDFSIGLLIPAALTPLIALYAARLLAIHRQWNTLLEGIPPLMIVVFVLLWPTDRLIAPLIFGVLSGYVLQTLILRLLAASQAGGASGFRFSFQSPQWTTSRKFLGMMLLGQFLMSWVTPIDAVSATRLGEGALAQLGYAERVLTLLLGLGATAISMAVLPVFSEMAASGAWRRLRKVAVQWGLLMAVVGLLVAASAWVIAPWGIGVLYERGAFGADDTVAVTEVFRWGLTRLPFYFAGLVFVQLLASQQLFGIIALIALTCAASKYLLNQMLVAQLGVSGINLATGIMYAWSMLCLLLAGLWAIQRRIS